MNKQEFRELPKLWQVLEVALNDFDLVLKNPRIQISMAICWHAYDPDNGTCHVCLAGAVMHQSFEEPLTRLVTPDDYNRDIARRLESLDHLRRGDVRQALKTFYQDPTVSHVEVPITSFSTSHKAWRAGMDEILLLLLDNDL